MSVVNKPISPLPAAHRPSPPPAAKERPRKRRRGAACSNKVRFEVPEDRNAEVFEKCEYFIDGPYRRAPPYYYVPPALFKVNRRHIIPGLNFVG